LRRRCGDSATAEDLAQETFYRATQAFLGWRGESPAGWLLAIARNVLIDDVRRERPTLPLKDPLDNQVEKPEWTVETEDALDRLPPDDARL